MANYFPYSHIIQSLRSAVQQTISRHSYFGEWNVCECERQEHPVAGTVISEIYY